MPFKDKLKTKQYRKEYYRKNKSKLQKYNKEYQDKHIERLKKYQAEYRAENKDKNNAYQIDYREQNEEKLKAYRKLPEVMERRRKSSLKYYYAHLEKKRKYNKQYYQNNKKQVLKCAKEYRNKPLVRKYRKDYHKIYLKEYYQRPEVKVARRIYKLNRRAREKGGGGRINKKMFNKLQNKFNSCVYCGAKHRLEVDHFIPLNKGGNNNFTNLVISCKSCNSSKQDHLPHIWCETKNISHNQILEKIHNGSTNKTST